VTKADEFTAGELAELHPGNATRKTVPRKTVPREDGSEICFLGGYNALG
jgi:hypothetical protein